MQSVALDVVAGIVCTVAFLVSVRYFLRSKPDDGGRLERERLILGRIHPAVLVRMLLAAVLSWASWSISVTLMADGERLIAGMVLAASTPAALCLALTLFALPFAFGPGEVTRPTPEQITVRPKTRLTVLILFAFIVAGAATIPFLR